ncbi:protein of unknown function [Candidatus Nitrosotalea okcheonensis]|uniref:Uncharacterized protein n=1 Tax=Candidatus Nitrosotalea okcheonensis TaxID=1903276 RepID=A0A2H1FFF2_9ARCH|nr:protein of unknown function [Candidatus Nitrosotalea okcheonensis]
MIEQQCMPQGSPRGELAVTNNPIHQSVIIHRDYTRRNHTSYL